MENAIIEVQQNQYGVINFEEYAMSRTGVIKQVAIIQDVMHGVMKLDEHYRTIPGTNKASLYKAGAEKLSLTFRLRPEYQISKTDLPGGHREYEIVCTLYHIPTGQSVGQGVGAATTMEGKYRFRPGPVELTGKPVPKEYWTERNINLLGGKGFVPKKNDSGQWEIARKGESVEHDNPADYYNTVLKMAKKRAHVDAILTATAASDIFTQDVEDMPEVILGANGEGKPAPEKKPPIQPPQKKADANKPTEDAQTATVNIAAVTHKSGEKGGKPYTIFTIFDRADVKYGTFSETFANLAKEARDNAKQVNITYTVGQYGNNIVTMELAAA